MTIRTVTVSGVTAVYFDPNSTNPYFYASEKYCWVKNNSSAAMYVSLDSTCTAGADGTALIAAGETGMIQLSPANTIYISGSGSAEIRTADVAVCPFKNGGKGGEKSLNYLGVTTTALSDGATTNPIMIDGESVTAKKDDYVTYNSKDFIFNGTTWHEVGDLENYYTKSETDTLLSAKANAADVYTKSAVDTLLSAKANITDVYLKSDFIVNDTVTQQEITDSINNIWD